MPSVKFIVETHIGWDRKTWIPDPEWVRLRADFFHQYTLKSIKNQTFKDFEVFVQCGNRNKEMLKNYNWDPLVNLCFDRGEKRYTEMNTDYVSITRIDSDDLMHKDAMAEVKDNLIFSRKREVLVFFDWYAWNLLNHFIKRNHIRSSSPFFTHIFPKAVYKNWTLFNQLHCCGHGSGGAGDRGGKRLSGHMICITRHAHNTSNLKRGIKVSPHSEAEDAELKKKLGDEIIDDPDEMFMILKNFGIKREQIK